MEKQIRSPENELEIPAGYAPIHNVKKTSSWKRRIIAATAGLTLLATTCMGTNERVLKNSMGYNVQNHPESFIPTWDAGWSYTNINGSETRHVHAHALFLKNVVQFEGQERSSIQGPRTLGYYLAHLKLEKTASGIFEYKTLDAANKEIYFR